MLITLLLSLILVYWFHVRVIAAMRASLDVGFVVIGWLKKYGLLIEANLLYALGLYIHNFVFRATDMRSVIVSTFVCMSTYDMASRLNLDHPGREVTSGMLRR